MLKGKCLKKETLNNMMFKIEKLKYKMLILKTKAKIIIKKFNSKSLVIFNNAVNSKKTKCIINAFKKIYLNTACFINKKTPKVKSLLNKLKCLTEELRNETQVKLDEFKTIAKENPRALLKLLHICVPAICVIILICTVCYWNNSNYGLVLACNGEEVATIESEHTFEEASQKVSERLVHDETSDEVFEVAPTYKLTVANNQKCEDSNTVCNKLIEKSKGTIEEAHGLYVNDQLLGVVKDGEKLDEMLNDVLNSACTNENAKASFIQEVKNVNGLYPAKSVVNEDQMKNLINTPVSDEAFYTVKDGDVPGTIAANFNMDLEQLQKINDINLEDLMYPGYQVKVQVAKKPLTVSVTVEETYEASIPFDTVTTKDDNEYKTFSEVTNDGVEGKQTLIDSVTYVDGIEIQRENISKTVIQEPVNKEVTVGTKEQSVQTSSYSQGTGRSTGNLMWPVPSTRLITSPYGYRWGRLHSGIDIGASSGNSIVAADGGTISYVNFSGSGYGNHLMINHGNGTATLYAHCSAIYVASGSRVSKGQVIAAVGSTGDSTGPHLHFEVIVGGSKVNPQNYV